MRILICLFSILLLTAGNSYSNINKTDRGNIKERSKQNDQDTLLTGFGCYYKLDDKYSQSKDTAGINKWWQSKLNEFELNGIQNSLFEDHGGGPNGAEWNPSTDLFVVAATNKILKNETVVLELNKKKIPGIKLFKYLPDSKTGTILYFKLPQALWEKHLRKIKPNDLEGIYGKEKINILKKNRAVPLDAGEIIEITMKIKHNKNDLIVFKDFFHIARGE
jgi:hypothetical protein